MARVRISDVAASAGVSTATVSRALNGAATVDKALAERVLRTARELGYQPNRIARSLRRRASSVLALLISDVENPFFTSVARSVENAALEAGYSVVLCNTDESTAKERNYLDVVLAEQAAGVLIAPTSERTDLGPLHEHNVPYVLIDRKIRGGRSDAVVVDNRSGAAMATTHLLDAGYERVACIAGPAKLSTGIDRQRGYEAALRAAGHPVDRRYIRRTDFRVDGGRRAATELFDLAEPPDAVFVANNLMAAGAMQALVGLGVAIPGQVGIACFDDSPWAPLTAPPLTTVVQPTYDLGREATRLLLRRLDGWTGEPEVVTLPTTLRVRDSSAGPAR